MTSFLSFQLADAAFPGGGFAHSGGLEAATALGEVKSAADLRAFVTAGLWQAGLGVLPFIREAHVGPRPVHSLDALADAWLTNHVANRASRAQGRGLLGTCARIFDCAPIEELFVAARTRHIAGHFAPMLGAVTSLLGMARLDSQALALHLVVRGTVSSAVRLGIVGPHEGQSIQFGAASIMDQVLEQCEANSTDDLSQPAPILEVLAAQHDRLYSKLFQS